MPSTACRRRSGATSFPRRRPPAPALPRTGQLPAAATERSRAPDPSSFWPGRLEGHRTPCASGNSFAQKSPLLCKPGPNSCPVLSIPRFGATSAPPAPHSSSDLAACPTPSILADPLNQPGPKPAGQVTGLTRLVGYASPADSAGQATRGGKAHAPLTFHSGHLVRANYHPWRGSVAGCTATDKVRLS